MSSCRYADVHLSTALAAERTAFGLCFATTDQKEGMAAFLEKKARTPRANNSSTLSVRQTARRKMFELTEDLIDIRNMA